MFIIYDIYMFILTIVISITNHSENTYFICNERLYWRFTRNRLSRSNLLGKCAEAFGIEMTGE